MGVICGYLRKTTDDNPTITVQLIYSTQLIKENWMNLFNATVILPVSSYTYMKLYITLYITLQTLVTNRFLLHSPEGIPEGIPGHSHRIFWTWAGDLHYCGCCGDGGKGRGTSRDPGQDLEGKRPWGIPGALRAGRADPSHQTGGDGNGITCQADVTMREELPR